MTAMTGKRQGKTYLMRLVENRHPGQTIEALMVNAFRTHGREKEAANALGITQQTFNAWKYRLGLQDRFVEVAPAKAREPHKR